MNWYELDILKLADSIPSDSRFERLSQAFDIKYGNYDYSQDIRALCKKEFSQTFISILEDSIKRVPNDPQIIIGGCNSGYEVKYVKHSNITAIDMSKRALRKLKRHYPNTNSILGDIKDLPFKDHHFDIFIAMRTLSSVFTDLDEYLFESIRLVKKIQSTLILSIPNGYNIGGEVVKGMYFPHLKKFDLELPYYLSKYIRDFYTKLNLKVSLIDITSEIIIIIKT